VLMEGLEQQTPHEAAELPYTVRDDLQSHDSMHQSQPARSRQQMTLRISRRSVCGLRVPQADGGKTGMIYSSPHPPGRCAGPSSPALTMLIGHHPSHLTRSSQWTARRDPQMSVKNSSDEANFNFDEMACPCVCSKASGRLCCLAIIFIIWNCLCLI
jgi:hypothetical protein